MNKHDDLPPLPLTASQFGFSDTPAFSANQMRRYARKALRERKWVGLTIEDKHEYTSQDLGGNRLDAMDWAEKRLKEKNYDKC